MFFARILGRVTAEEMERLNEFKQLEEKLCAEGRRIASHACLKPTRKKRKKYDWKNICFFQCASVEFSLAVLKTPRTTTHINGLTVSTCKCFSNLCLN